MNNTQAANSWNYAAGLERLDGDSSLMREVASMLHELMAEQASAVKRCVLQQNHPALRLLTHSQLPSLKILGFDEEAKVFEDFEAVTLRGDALACETLAPQVLHAWDAIVRSLGNYLQAGPAATSPA